MANGTYGADDDDDDDEGNNDVKLKCPWTHSWNYLLTGLHNLLNAKSLHQQKSTLYIFSIQFYSLRNILASYMILLLLII